MQDLSKYTRRNHFQVHSKHVPVLVIGFLALNGLVFALGLIIGNRATPAAGCEQIDPLAVLDAQAQEPAPPSKADFDFSFHESLKEQADQVPTPWSLKNAKATEVATKEIQPKTIETLPIPKKLTEPPIPETVRDNERGVYTLQVGSFEKYPDASEMVQRLELAGHKAFVISVKKPNTKDRWFRVRVGPFRKKQDAWEYKRRFEAEERLPAFVVKRSAKKIVPTVKS